MIDIKFTTFYGTYNDDRDISQFLKVCVYLPNEALVLNKKGEVFRVYNSAFNKLEIFNNKNVIDFAYATTTVHSKLEILCFVLTEYEIYGWGPNGYRQVSINDAKDVTKPQKISIPSLGLFRWDRFTSISCVYGHCMALTDDNCLILWGNNSHGQIGTGTISTVEAPYRIKFRKPIFGKTEFNDKRIIDCTFKITSIACSSRNSYAMLENGDVYGWGSNCIGQLGTLLVENFLSPHNFFGNVKQIVAVNNYALVLKYDGSLYGLGDNSLGQVGGYNGNVFYNPPHRLDLKFEKCASFHNLSMGLTIDGRCFIWGDYGQIKFTSVRLKITVDKRKVSQSTQVNLCEEETEILKSSNEAKANPVIPKAELLDENESEIDSGTGDDSSISRLDDFQEKTNEENLFVENDKDKNLEKATQIESEKQGESNTVIVDTENTSKTLEEKRKIRELLENGEIESHCMNLTLKRPTEIKCKSFSKIIAKRFNQLYVTDKSDLSNGYRNDYENDMIDTSNFIVVIYEYYEIVEQKVEPVAKFTDKSKKNKLEKNKESEKIKKLEERIQKVEQKETTATTIQKFHIGDKSKVALFDKSTISKVEDFSISENDLAGIVGAGASKC